MKITRDSRIVEVFSSDLLNKKVDKNELKDANIYVQELANDLRPDNRYEIAKIMSYIIDESLTQRTDYLEMIADVKKTGFQERAQFNIKVDGLKAFYQAKSSTTERSRVSNKHVYLDTDEVSIRPNIDFLNLASGKEDITKISQNAARKLEIAIVKRIQNAVYSAFVDLEGVNYGTGAGITKGTFDPLLYTMRRAGGQANIIGDPQALAKFTEISGFSDRVPEKLAVEHNENGMIGSYNGSSLVQLDNPLAPHTLEETELRKDLIYIVPAVEDGLKPIKVQLEGDVQYMEDMNIDSKEIDLRFDQHVGVGVVGDRRLLAIYEDSSLSESP